MGRDGGSYLSRARNIKVRVVPEAEQVRGMGVSQVKMLRDLEVAISIPAARLIRTLEKVIWTMGKPKNIRCDNGPEFIAGIFQQWCKANDINLLYIQPGHPTQNSYIERFNGSYRRAVLDAYLFRTLDDVRKITGEWNRDYNENRPHDSLGDMSPREYKLNYIENLCTFASPI